MRNTFVAVFFIATTIFGAGVASAQLVTAQPQVATKTLSNGLHVLVVEDHAAAIVQTAVWYRFGSLYEVAGRTGLAHALEHMMFRGSAHISAGGLDAIVARLGAQMNAETTYDYTHFFFVMPADKLDVALTIEADRMQRALIEESQWRIERGAVLSEIDGDSSSPFFSLLALVRAAAFPNSSAGLTPLGRRGDVARAQASDIARYYRGWYAPNNATLVVTGDVNPQRVFELAQRRFGNIASKRLPARPAQHPTAASGKSVSSPFPFPYDVVDIAYAIPGDSEPGEPAISTLATLINNERGPFYRALVESSAALAVTANADTQLRGGLMHVFIVVNPGRTAAESQALFLSAMQQALRNGFDPDLIAAARRATIAERILDTDSIGGLADLVGYTYGVVGERVSDEDQRLAALTRESINQVARTYLSKPTVIGHLSPSAQPPAGRSSKITAGASDNFSSRVPNGPITMPRLTAQQVRAPTTARSKLSPVRFKLANGLTVLWQPRPDRPTVTVRGIIDSAARFEPEGKAGIARLASDVANFGSEHYDFAAQRSAIDALGAQINLGQSFSARGLAKDLDAMLQIVSDAEMHPTFPDRYFTQERDQLASSIPQEQNISGEAIDRAYLQLLLEPSDPALRFPSQQSVAQLTRADVLDYTRRYWRPDLTTLSIVGNVSLAQARNAVNTYFGPWANLGSTPSTREPALPAPHSAHTYIGTDANNVFIKLGHSVMPRTSPDYDAFTLLSQIIAGPGSFESRLMNELRQKRGLIYNVTSKVDADRDRGDFSIAFSASPQNVVPAVRFVRTELLRLQREPVSAAELSQAKTRLVSDALLEEESPGNQLQELLSLARFGLPLNYYATLNDRYQRITAADLQRVARKYLHPNAMIEIYAGPSGAWSQRGLL
ncbi:MAG: insulinase family protein [Candidatus Eremiobacteraeota bacterium]|nr:insulinase family protein [Candidatus Eremiobacteraeota bacterium]